MKRQYIRGRNRILTPELRVKLCQLVREGATLVEGAETLGVSLRTVQRERKYDEDFDHELRLALASPPDPLKLMQAAARTHWRAAAWLLERTRPEQYARRPNNMANAAQVNHAVNAVMEVVLQLLPAEQQERLFPHIDAACQRAIDCCFPNLGPWGRPRSPKLPQTPLGNHLRWKMLTQAPGVPAFIDDDDAKLVEEFTQRAEGFIPSVEDEPDDDATVIEDAPAPRPSNPASDAATPDATSLTPGVAQTTPTAPQPSSEDLYELALNDAMAEFDPDCHEQRGCAPGKQHCHAINQSSPCSERQHPEPSPATPLSRQPGPPHEPQDNFVAKNAFGDKMPATTELPPSQERRHPTT